MRWLIDGYNVIRRDSDLRGREAESLEAGRAALIHLVARKARESRDDFKMRKCEMRDIGSEARSGIS